MKKIYFLLLLSAVSFLAECRKDNFKYLTGKSASARTYSGEYIRNYFSLMCHITRSTKGFFPTQAARAYGYVGIASYESVVHGIRGGISLYGQLNGLTQIPQPNANDDYNWAISSNAAVAEVMRKMFDQSIAAGNLHLIDSAETTNLATLSAGVSQDVLSRSVQYGKDVAAAIYLSSTTDGGHQSYLNPFQLPFTAPTGPSDWVPTGAVTTPVSPKWGTNRPFIPANINRTTIAPPIDFSTDTGSAFYKQAAAVYKQVQSNTPDQVEIAKFWADDPFNTCTPTGHTFNILIQLLKQTNATLEKTSVAFAKLAIAENDGFIACWRGKYQYTLLRPVTYIKKYINATFATVIGTPPFPSYTSGHSCEIGAAEKIFIDLFTDGSGNYNFTDLSQVQYGFAPRNYTNFHQLALECANSRFYGGIHYDMDNVNGLALGNEIGINVNNMIHWPQNIE